jgi:propanol-preferring alcohol dehydrogenase
MKAWQFNGINEPLERVEIPYPKAGTGEIVVDIKAAGLCHSDVSFMDGTITSLLKEIPIILGHEIAGVVAEIGEGVSDFQPGQRVGIPATTDGPGTYRNGGFADAVVVLANQCVHVPDEVPFEQAAPAMDAARTAYRAVVTTGLVQKGINVGIIGYGGLGSLGVQIAKELGAEVYVAEVNTKTWDEAKATGIKGISADIRDFEQAGLDVIIDFAGFGTTTASAIDAIKPRGRVVQIGLAKEMATISAQKVTMKEITYVGASNGEKHEAEEVLKLMASGNIKSNIIKISFDKIPDSLDQLKKGGINRRFVAIYE